MLAILSLQTRIVPRTARWVTALSVSFLLFPTALFSQQSDTTANVDRQTIQSLLDRIASLEASDKQLRERVAQLESAKSGVTAQNGGSTSTEVSASAKVTLASVTTAAPGADPPRAEQSLVAQSDPQGAPTDQDQMDVSKTSLNIRGFGDFGVYGGNQKGQTTSFSLGQTNLFITSNLSERFKFLSELVFEVHQDNAFRTILERILLEYSVNDYFKLSAGRYHTAIGYYNTAYHNSTWFQTATERPDVFEYEDEGGILPPSHGWPRSFRADTVGEVGSSLRGGSGQRAHF